MTKIVLLIDYLCPGGAQRQLCMLAVLLKQQGFHVEILTYHPADFYAEMLAQGNVEFTYVQSTSKIGRVLKLRREIRQRRPDIVISFLHSPNLIAELAGFPCKSFKVVASERNTDYGDLNLSKVIRYLFHLLADAVVANSYSQKDYLSRKASYLESKVHVITNCVDLNYFNPSDHKEPDDCVKILSVGRYHPQKNYDAMIDSILLFNKRMPGNKFTFDWHGDNFFRDGRPTAASQHFLHLKARVEKHSLQSQIRLHGPNKNVLSLYSRASALCLASKYEGFSNVIGEAIACGLPVIASKAGDNQRMVVHGENGFLFDSTSSDSLAGALECYAHTDPQTRQAMSQKSRTLALNTLTPEAFLEKYIHLFHQLGLSLPAQTSLLEA